jgi:hypothetical protein
MELDFSVYDESNVGRPLPPEGLHTVSVYDTSTAPSRDGNKMLTLTLRSESGGWDIVDRLTFTAKSSSLSLMKLIELGVKKPEPPQTKLELDPLDLRGRRVLVQVVHEPYTDKNGNQRVGARVAAFNSVTAGLKPCGYLNAADAERMGLMQPADVVTPF